MESDSDDDSSDDDSELLREYEKIKEQRQKEELFRVTFLNNFRDNKNIKNR